MPDDELEWAREVLGGATPGPWEAEFPRSRHHVGWIIARDSEGGREDICRDAFGNRSAIALLGSTWPQLLAVVEAADALMEPRPINTGGSPQRLRNALEAYKAALRAHRERTSE